jgi:hypothetical protein
MPRYYFDWSDNGRTVRDEDGIDLPDLVTAREEAAKGLAGLARDVLPSAVRRDLGITVRDEDGQPIFTTSIVFEIKMLSRNST